MDGQERFNVMRACACLLGAGKLTGYYVPPNDQFKYLTGKMRGQERRGQGGRGRERQAG